MKYLLLFTLFVLISFTTVKSQSLTTAPTGEAGLFSGAQGGSPMLNLVMMELRNKENTGYVGETLGSPYSSENFVKSKVFYENELQGDFYIRYNALNSIIEIKNTTLSEEGIKQLYPDKKVSIKYLNKVLRFTTYINKKNQTKNGYLSLIHDGANYKLYHRLAVKYSEGKAAANSMVADIPSRFAHFEEFYYQKVGVDRIDYLPSKKGAFLKCFDKELRDNVKLYLKENSINLHQENQLIQAFEFVNNL